MRLTFHGLCDGEVGYQSAVYQSDAPLSECLSKAAEVCSMELRVQTSLEKDVAVEHAVRYRASQI